MQPSNKEYKTKTMGELTQRMMNIENAKYIAFLAEFKLLCEKYELNYRPVIIGEEQTTEIRISTHIAADGSFKMAGFNRDKQTKNNNGYMYDGKIVTVMRSDGTFNEEGEPNKYPQQKIDLRITLRKLGQFVTIKEPKQQRTDITFED